MTAVERPSSGGDVRRFDDGVELARVGSLLARSVAGLLPAPERYVIVETRRRQVDHDQAALGIALEVTRVFQRRRDDAGGEAERRRVGGGERFVVVAAVRQAG